MVLIFSICSLELDSNPVKESAVFKPLHYPTLNMAWEDLERGGLTLPAHTEAYLSWGADRLSPVETWHVENGAVLLGAWLHSGMACECKASLHSPRFPSDKLCRPCLDPQKSELSEFLITFIQWDTKWKKNTVGLIHVCILLMTFWHTDEKLFTYSKLTKPFDFLIGFLTSFG